MKNKVFAVRLVNLILIVAILLVYQFVLVYRSQGEKIAYLESQIASAQAAEGAADGDGAYADGTYSGQAEGFGGPIAVEVTVDGGKMTDIQITSAEKEDGAYMDMAVDVIDEMLEKQTADVDTVSGATFSSTGIINAVKQALEGAVQ